eukprot:7760070-Heterocapsa_arctica.AAC.1
MYPGTGQSDVDGHAMFDMFFTQHVEAVMSGETSLPEKEVVLIRVMKAAFAKQAVRRDAEERFQAARQS